MFKFLLLIVLAFGVAVYYFSMDSEKQEALKSELQEGMTSVKETLEGTKQEVDDLVQTAKNLPDEYATPICQDNFSKILIPS